MKFSKLWSRQESIICNSLLFYNYLYFIRFCCRGLVTWSVFTPPRQQCHYLALIIGINPAFNPKIRLHYELNFVRFPNQIYWHPDCDGDGGRRRYKSAQLSVMIVLLVIYYSLNVSPRSSLRRRNENLSFSDNQNSRPETKETSYIIWRSRVSTDRLILPELNLLSFLEYRRHITSYF